MYNYSFELHKYSFFDFHYGNHLLIIGFYYGNRLLDFIFSSAYTCACIYEQKITAPNNGVVSSILNNRRKFGRASDRGCEAVLMDCGLWFSYIWGRIKPEIK